ncbi:hypothetical protein [Thermomonas flagellata]|uniref:hypothetical protein n=1 Tax=Thermomonas flagellata TaxID=2888524 RepID=UPI001F05019A|nr:hypothetical protein [Thermomonas flagellata]
MDRATAEEVRAAFAAATQLHADWTLGGDDAALVAVDMDSLYGPMSWLKLHAAGKQVIGLSARGPTQADFHLPRPVTAQALAALLHAIAAGSPPPGIAPPTTERAAMPAGTDPADNASEREPAPAAPPPAVVDEAPAADAAPTTAGDRAPDPATHDAGPRPLWAWLLGDRLPPRVQLRLGDGLHLLIDLRAGQWHGPTALKPMTDALRATADLAAFVPLDDAAWADAAAALGPPQPLQRLRWFAGLVAGNGRLLDGHPADTLFRLRKWPQTEREYPRHFRIATAMMKGPARVAEIAAASSTGEDEVADFVNAQRACGNAEVVVAETPPPSAPAAGGLLGRLRGR